MLLLHILRNKNLLTSEDVIDVQYVLATMGFLPSKPQKLVRRRSARRAKQVLPLLFLLFLFQCKPKTLSVAEQAKVQVKDKLTRTYEKAIAAVDTMPAPVVDGILTNDNETRQLFEHFYELERKH